MIHEDDRRILEDWPEAKIITAKRPCILGDHYHKIKTEKFILASGTGQITRDGKSEIMVHGKIYEVLPEVKHSFWLDVDSVLIGLCSHPFDTNDDYK